MMRFIETIKIENGIAHNLDLHLERASKTCFHHFGVRTVLPFDKIINEIRSSHNEGIYKLRIIYAGKIEHYTIEKYQPKIVKTLKIVDGGNIDYSFKYEDRLPLNKLLDLRGDCDDIIIIKDGFVTDTSFSNLVFSVEEQLFTPSSFLLNGIKRQRLLRDGKIKEKEIKMEDLNKYSNIFLINSMADFIQINRIVK
ncbi:MAG: aminotransferase class IV [Bacteroidales bacterium]|nr:aminotransferase class IV [Bacteroidales bacterium]